MIRTLSICLLSLALAACGKDDDAGDGMSGDGMTPGMSGPTKLPITSVGTISSPTDKDASWGCLGTTTEPARTSSVVDFMLRIEDFQEDTRTPGVKVQIFADNVIDPNACPPSNCTEGTTDAMGLVSGKAPAGAWFAYRVFAKAGPTSGETVVGSVQFNEAAPKMAGGESNGISVSAKTLDLIPTVLGFRRTPDTGLIAGRLFDCKDDDVYGARVTVKKTDGTVIPEGKKQAEPHYRYFNGDAFPSATQAFTHVDGLFAIANLPISDGKSEVLIVELEGRRAGDDEPIVLGRERVRVFPDTVTVINVGPLRVDGPK